MKLRIFFLKEIFTVLSLAILLAGCNSGPAWVRKADLPEMVAQPSTNVMGGRIYVIGGFDWGTDERVGSTQFEVYDPIANTWAKMADLLTGRGSLASEVVDGKIYTFGGSPKAGSPSISAVEGYDLTANSWSKLADIEEAVDGATAAQVDGKIFVIGGAQYTSQTQERISISTVEEYDPAANTWSKKADMPSPRYASASSVINGKIYIFGGMISTLQMVTPEYATQAVEVYDPQTDTWSKKADMPAPRGAAAAAALNGKIYIFGGADIDYTDAASTVFIYDPHTDTWTSAPDMPFNRLGMTASVVNGRVYILGGSAQSFVDGTPDLSVWEFTP